MSKKIDFEKKDRFVVVAIRHFENGEHHWFAPEGTTEYEDDPKAFGAVGVSDYYKPVFEKLDDAVNWAMSMVHGMWALAQWEYKRPTFVVITEDEWEKMVEDPEYTYPAGSEEWTDAQVDDWERADDIRWMMRVCQWDSESDCEHANSYVRRVNDIEGLTAWLEDDGTIAVHYDGDLLGEEMKEQDGLPSAIIESSGNFPAELMWDVSKGSDYVQNIAWFKVVEV